MDILTVRKLRKQFRGFSLEIDDLSIHTGEAAALVGENGAGKSTLIRCIMQFIRDYEGDILVKGDRFTGSERSIISCISYMSEELDLIEDLTARDHLTLAADLSPTWDRDVQDRLVQALTLTLDKPVKHLSRGNRVKLGIVVALSRRPKLLVLDEPTSGLDPVVRQLVLSELCRMRDSGCSVLISSHLLDDLRELADFLAIMSRGKIISIHPPATATEELRKDILSRLGAHEEV